MYIQLIGSRTRDKIILVSLTWVKLLQSLLQHLWIVVVVVVRSGVPVQEGVRDRGRVELIEAPELAAFLFR